MGNGYRVNEEQIENWASVLLRSTTNTEPASQVISLGCSWPSGVIKAVHQPPCRPLRQDNDCTTRAKSSDGFLTHVWLPQMHRGSLLSALHWCSSPRESSRHMTDEQYNSEDRKGVSGGVSLCFVCGRRRVIVHALCERAGQLTAATKDLMMHFKPAISTMGVTWPQPLFVLLARQ